MRSIWKYNIDTTDFQHIEMPLNAAILTVQMQDGIPRIWCMVDTKDKVTPRRISTIGTGHSVNSEFRGSYIGTYQRGAGVFHVFDHGH